MSRRTSEANRAIASAWSNEQQLVREGKGTRDWTPQQQRDILEKGKAYDDNGKAFEGHHMKNAERFPEYQGDPENIQFLKRNEHFDAHNGNFQNPTNGYYDVKSGKTIDFGNNPPKAPKPEKLSDTIFKNDATEQHSKFNTPGKFNSQSVASEKGGGSQAPPSNSNTTQVKGELPKQNSNSQTPSTTPKGELPQQNEAPDTNQGDKAQLGGEQGGKYGTTPDQASQDAMPNEYVQVANGMTEQQGAAVQTVQSTGMGV